MQSIRPEDGQGDGGDKVITVFLDLTTELGTRVTRFPDGSETKVPNASNWERARRETPKGSELDVLGDSTVTGNKGFPKLITDGAYEGALKKSNAVVYIGHGVQTDPPPLNIPFHQEAIRVGNKQYTPGGTGDYITGGSSIGPKPNVSADVVASFTCDSARTGSSFYNFTGKNQYMVSVDSGSDGITSSSTLERAAYAFTQN